MKGQPIGYIWVSSLEQNSSRQLDSTYEEKISTIDTNHSRFQKMLSFVCRDDIVRVHSMERLARNLDDFRDIVRKLTQKGVKVQFIKENLIFSGDDSAMAQLLLSVMGAFAEFERSLLKERQREGIELAKKRGVYKGRQKCLSTHQIMTLQEALKVGITKARMARNLGVSRETVYRYLREHSWSINQ